MKATALLRKDHEALRTSVGRLTKPARGPDKDKAAHLRAIREELLMHTRIEEELFYPEIENTTSTQAAALVKAAVAQHREIDKLLEDVSERANSDKVDAQLAALTAKLNEHLQFEEDQIFEEARQYISEYRMEELGLEMEER